MRVAELSQVAPLYPHVPPLGIEYVLWALHRVVPLAEAGDTDAALAQLRADLASYAGELEDLARLGVMSLFRGLERGRAAFAGALGAQGLLAPEPGTVTRYVIVGPLLDARLWARQRNIGQNTTLTVTHGSDAYRLRGLPGKGVAIVRLGDRRGDPVIETALSALIDSGAITLSPHWAPGAAAEPGEPRLDLQLHPQAPRATPHLRERFPGA